MSGLKTLEGLGKITERRTEIHNVKGADHDKTDGAGRTDGRDDHHPIKECRLVTAVTRILILLFQSVHAMRCRDLLIKNIKETKGQSKIILNQA